MTADKQESTSLVIGVMKMLPGFLILKYHKPGYDSMASLHYQRLSGGENALQRASRNASRDSYFSASEIIMPEFQGTVEIFDLYMLHAVRKYAARNMPLSRCFYEPECSLSDRDRSACP